VVDRATPRMHPPLAWPYVLLLALLLVVVFLAVQIGTVGLAAEKLGLSPQLALGFLLASIVGSTINIPIGQIPAHGPLEPAGVVRHLGVGYLIPHRRLPGTTVLAVNVGGAVVPSLLAIYLLVHDNLGSGTFLAVAAVVLYVHIAARPVQGIGIVVPGIFPPLVAAGAAILLGGPHVAAVAYVGGVAGCLIGADLMNLGRLPGVGAPVASIGGAGTFDGIFLTGLMAVLMASFFS